MTYYFNSFLTDLGEFSVAVDSQGALVATAFGAEAELRRRVKPCTLLPDAVRTKQARSQVQEYFSGQRRDFELPLAPVGSTFQKAVWSQLQRIPFGQTRSYGSLAATLGRPKAARAVGRANATNPICLVVPCHRVIGSDGSLTGFAFGEKTKRRLLEHEGASTAATA